MTVELMVWRAWEPRLPVDKGVSSSGRDTGASVGGFVHALVGRRRFSSRPETGVGTRATWCQVVREVA